jgi:putative Mn2+ efflux pump MntP
MWSGKLSEDVVEVSLETPNRTATKTTLKTVYVLPEYEERIKRYNHGLVHYAKFFVIINCVPAAVSILSIAVGIAFGPGKWFMFIPAATIMLMGFTLIVMPFSTPETAPITGGLRSAIQITRFGGILLILIGVWMTTF